MDTRTDAGLDPRLESLLEHVDWARALAGRLVADAARADDVVQSALAAAVKSPPRDATNLRAWLGEVVRNAARGIGREEGRRAQRERASARPEALEAADELVARAERTRDLAQHVLALDAIYRDVVLLRWYEGLAPREIAKRLDVPVATVNTRLARAHAELRTRLDRSYGDRATWCVALAPTAFVPQSGMSAVSIGALALLLVAGVIGAVTVLERRGPEPEVARLELSEPASLAADARAPIDEPASEVTSRSSASTANAPRRYAALPPGSAKPPTNAEVFASLGSTRVEGRAIGFDGRGVAGLTLVARDPTLPQLADGWLRVGNQATTVDPGQIETWKYVPVLLEETLKHWGNPRGLREVLLGAELSVTTTTGADGTFAVDVPGSQARLAITDEHFRVLAGGQEGDTEAALVLVAPTVLIAGTIVAEDGQPLAGARLDAQGLGAALALLPHEFDERNDLAEDVRSDGQGRFDLGRVATFPGARLVASSESQELADVPLPESDATALVITGKVRAVPANPRVRGVVLDARGVGIEGATVRVSTNSTTRSGPDGRFDLEVSSFSATDELVALRDGYAPGWVAGLWSELREKRVLDDVVVRLAGPPLTITGRALDARGDPLENWLVTLDAGVKYPGMGIPLEFAAAGMYGDDRQPRTNREGRFELPGLAPQPYRIRLVDPRTGILHASDPVEAPARATSRSASPPTRCAMRFEGACSRRSERPCRTPRCTYWLSSPRALGLRDPPTRNRRGRTQSARFAWSGSRVAGCA